MEAVFLKILNMSITASYVFAFVFVLRLLLKRAPKWISYTLWSVLLFRLVCPVSFSSAFSILRSIGAPAAESGSVAYIPSNIGTMTAPTVNVGISSLSEAINGALPAATSVASANPLQIWIFIGACVWLAGIAVMLIYSAVSYIRLRRRMSDATLLFDNVFETDVIATPFVCGFMKPKIYLPVGLSESEHESVLLHERTHIARCDHLIKPLAFLVLSVYWFHPLVWLAFVLLSRDMEMSCDERVIKALSDEQKSGYSSALLHLAVRRPILAGSPLAFGESGAKGRIKNILNYRKPSFWVVLIAAVAATVVGVCLLANPSDRSPYKWAKSLTVDNAAEAYVWNLSTQTQAPSFFTDDELAEAVALINALEKDDFTENAELVGGTPEYGLALSYGDYQLNQSIDPRGSLEMTYKGSQWWIDSDALAEFVVKMIDASGQETALAPNITSSPVENAETSYNTPFPATDYADGSWQALYYDAYLAVSAAAAQSANSFGFFCSLNDLDMNGTPELILFGPGGAVTYCGAVLAIENSAVVQKTAWGDWINLDAVGIGVSENFYRGALSVGPYYNGITDIGMTVPYNSLVRVTDALDEREKYILWEYNGTEYDLRGDILLCESQNGLITFTMLYSFTERFVDGDGEQTYNTSIGSWEYTVDGTLVSQEEYERFRSESDARFDVLPDQTTGSALMDGDDATAFTAMLDSYK